ncbi:MAG: hypothetical protein ACRBCI_16095 [Cellvibrionaceae bacterium]
MKNIITWIFSIFVAFIFAQSLVFKLSGSIETTIIFDTIAAWMSTIGMPQAIANFFSEFGGYSVALAELIAALLILVPKTRIIGASLGLVVISGAIFFHLFTPLGIDRVVDFAGNTDGGALFYTACAVFVSTLIIIGLSVRTKLNNQSKTRLSTLNYAA